MRISDWSSDVCSSDLATLLRLAPVELDLGHPLAQRAVGEDGGRIAVGDDQRRMSSGSAQPAREVGGNGRAGQRGAAAVDDDPLVAVRQLDRKSTRLNSSH